MTTEPNEPTTSALTVTAPDGAVLDMRVGDRDELYDYVMASVMSSPPGTLYAYSPLDGVAGESR